MTKSTVIQIEQLKEENEDLGFIADMKIGFMKSVKISSDDLKGLLKKLIPKIAKHFGVDLELDKLLEELKKDGYF